MCSLLVLAGIAVAELKQGVGRLEQFVPAGAAGLAQLGARCVQQLVGQGLGEEVQRLFGGLPDSTMRSALASTSSRISQAWRR